MLVYPWPHNVRELEKVLSLATVLAEGGVLRAAHLPPALLQASKKVAYESVAPPATQEAPLRDELVAQLVAHRGNITRVAEAMGKARQQVHRWLRRMRIDPKVYRDR
jgi:transcriptional regulator of acetoin/glycerol metabolism